MPPTMCCGEKVDHYKTMLRQPSVGPEDYDLWRSRFGATPRAAEYWSGWHAQLDGRRNYRCTGPIGGDTYSGGPDIRVGRVETTNSVIYDITGTVVQNGPTTKLLLPYRAKPDSRLAMRYWCHSIPQPAATH